MGNVGVGEADTWRFKKTVAAKIMTVKLNITKTVNVLGIVSREYSKGWVTTVE